MGISGWGLRWAGVRRMLPLQYQSAHRTLHLARDEQESEAAPRSSWQEGLLAAEKVNSPLPGGLRVDLVQALCHKRQQNKVTLEHWSLLSAFPYPCLPQMFTVSCPSPFWNIWKLLLLNYRSILFWAASNSPSFQIFCCDAMPMSMQVLYLWAMNVWRCLLLNETVGPSICVLSAQTYSSSPGTQPFTTPYTREPL